MILIQIFPIKNKRPENIIENVRVVPENVQKLSGNCMIWNKSWHSECLIVRNSPRKVPIIWVHPKKKSGKCLEFLTIRNSSPKKCLENVRNFFITISKWCRQLYLNKETGNRTKTGQILVLFKCTVQSQINRLYHFENDESQYKIRHIWYK